MNKTVDNKILTPEEYKAEVIAKMKYYGATDKEIEVLVTDKLIRVQMLMKVHPHDLAWALMQ